MASHDYLTNMLLQGGGDEQVDTQYHSAPSCTTSLGLTGYPFINIGTPGVHGWTLHGLVPLPPCPTQVPIIMSAHIIPLYPVQDLLR